MKKQPEEQHYDWQRLGQAQDEEEQQGQQQGQQQQSKQQGQQQGQQQDQGSSETVEPNPPPPQRQGGRGGGNTQAQAKQTVQPQPRISGRQLMLIVALSRFTVMVVFLPVVTTGTAGRDAWLASILAVAGGMAVGLLASILAARFPGQSLGGIARAVAGIPGMVLAVVYAGYYFAFAIAETRLLSSLLVTVNLPRTPGWAVALPILLVAVYGAALGPDTLGRSSEILITFILLSLIAGLSLLVLSRVMDPGLLRPVLAFGVRPVLSSTVNPILWFSVSAGTVLALGKYCEPARLGKSVVAATAISGTVLMLMALVTIMTLGVGEAADQLSPLLAVARSVFFMGIAERIDVLLLNILMIGSVFDMTLFLLVPAVILSDVFRVNGTKIVIVLGLLAIVPLAYRRTDIFDFLRLFGVIPSGIIVVTVHIGLVGLLLLIALLRGKRGGSKQ